MSLSWCPRTAKETTCRSRSVSCSGPGAAGSFRRARRCRRPSRTATDDVRRAGVTVAPVRAAPPGTRRPRSPAPPRSSGRALPSTLLCLPSLSKPGMATTPAVGCSKRKEDPTEALRGPYSQDGDTGQERSAPVREAIGGEHEFPCFTGSTSPIGEPELRDRARHRDLGPAVVAHCGRHVRVARSRATEARSVPASRASAAPFEQRAGRRRGLRSPHRR